MRKHLSAFFALILTLYTSGASSTADGPDYWQVYGIESDDVLNIRKEPNWQSEKIGEIPHDGQCIKNLKCVGGLTYDEFKTLSEPEKVKILK